MRPQKSLPKPSQLRTKLIRKPDPPRNIELAICRAQVIDETGGGVGCLQQRSLGESVTRHSPAILFPEVIAIILALEQHKIHKNLINIKDSPFQLNYFLLR